MLRTILTAALIAAALGLVACGGDQVTPDVVGQRLDVAESNVEDAGLDSEAIGGGTFGIVNRSNWTVCQQDPAPGAEDPGTVELIVDRVCPDQPSDAAAPGAAPGAADPSAPSSERLQGRLEGAGYTVEETDPGTDDPPAQSALLVALGDGQVTIYTYSSPEDAGAAQAEFAPVEEESPDQIAVEREGSNLFVGTVEEPAELPEDEFAELIAAAKGE